MQSVKKARLGNTKVMSLSIQSEMFNRITDYCSLRGCTRTWFMNKAAELYLNECLEDKADYEAAVAAYAEWEKGDQKTYSLAEVRAELGL